MANSVMESRFLARTRPAFNWRLRQIAAGNSDIHAAMPSLVRFFTQLTRSLKKDPPAKWCLTPHWGTSTHDAVFDNVCKNLSLRNYRFDYCLKDDFRQKFPISNFIAWLIYVAYLPKIWLLRQRGDIRSLTILGINIGYAINEEGICLSNRAEFRFDEHGYRLIRVAINTLTHLTDCFKRKKIALVLGGDEVYILFSIAAQLAARHGVPCYFLKGDTDLRFWYFDCEKLTTVPIPPPGDARHDDLLRIGCGDAHVAAARKSLEDRARGDRKSLEYMPRTNEQTPGEGLPEGCVWIYLHDFYDAPGLFGDNLFVNHVAWVRETLRFCQAQHIPVAIKLHPNQRPLNGDIINALKSEFAGENIHWINQDFAPQLLIGRRALAVLTVYGTITVEATYVGAPVIAAGRTPFSQFDVAYQARDVAEYFSLIAAAASEKGLAPKEKENAVLAEAMFRSGASGVGKLAPDVPFDDVPNSIWRAVYGEDAPRYNFDRRDQFLRDPVLAEFVTRHLQARNLAAEIGLDELVPAQPHPAG